MNLSRSHVATRRLVLAAIAGGVAALSARPALAQHVFTNGQGNNLWCTPENWDPPTVPSGSAIIGPEITQRVGFASNCIPTFTSLTAQGPVLFDGVVRNSGPILASDVIVRSGSFEVGPTVRGNATFSINGLCQWQSGIIARQAFRVEAGATLTIDPISGHTLRSVEMTNSGTVTQRATVTLDGFCPIINRGTWTLATPNVSVSRLGAGNISTFVNEGLLSCELPSGQAGAPLMNVALHNEGEISAGTGDLDLLEFTSNGGQLSASTGRRITLGRDATFDGDSQCSGDGTVNVTIGLVRVDSGTLLTALDQSGTHAGGFTLNSTPGLVIAPDARLENAGTFTWVRGTLLGESGAGDPDGALVNSATFMALAATATIQNLRIQNVTGARMIVDPRTQLLLRDSSIDSSDRATLELRSGSIVRSNLSTPETPTDLVFRDAILSKTGPAPARVACRISAADGELNVVEGELNLDRAENAHYFFGTTISAASGADLVLNTAAIANSARIEGGGVFTLRAGSAVLSINDSITTNAMNGPGDGLVVDGGKITGTGRLRNTGKLTLHGGTLGDSGTPDPLFQFDNSGRVSVTNGGASRFAASILNLATGLIAVDAPINMTASATLYNEGELSLGALSNIGVIAGSPPPQIRNAGSIEKRGSGTSVVAVPLSNAAGEIVVQLGTLAISGPIEELTPNAAAPGTFTLGDGTYIVEPLGTLTFGGRRVSELARRATVRVRGSFTDCEPGLLSDSATADLGTRIAPRTPFVARDQSTLELAPGGELGTAPGGSPDATFRDSSRITGNGFVDRDTWTLDHARMFPGYSPGEITFRSLSMLGGTLAIEIGGPTPVTQHDRITVLNHAALGGTLELALLDGFAPPLDSTYTILIAGTLSGSFDRVIQPPGLASGLRLRPQASGSSVVLRVVLEADYNADGFVDFFDYLDFVTCFEGEDCPPGSDADFNGDGFVDFFDYLDFVTAFEGGG